MKRYSKYLALALAGILVLPVPAFSQSSKVHIDQVDGGRANGLLEKQLLEKERQRPRSSNSPLDLQFRLTDTPAPTVLDRGAGSTIRQHGTGNDAEVDADGDGNTTEQIQRGDHNSSLIELDGNNKTVEVGQFGDNNTSHIRLEGPTPQHVQHVQTGSGLSQPVISTTAPHLIVRQR